MRVGPKAALLFVQTNASCRLMGHGKAEKIFRLSPCAEPEPPSIILDFEFHLQNSQ